MHFDLFAGFHPMVIFINHDEGIGAGKGTEPEGFLGIQWEYPGTVVPGFEEMGEAGRFFIRRLDRGIDYLYGAHFAHAFLYGRFNVFVKTGEGGSGIAGQSKHKFIHFVAKEDRFSRFLFYLMKDFYDPAAHRRIRNKIKIPHTDPAGQYDQVLTGKG